MKRSILALLVTSSLVACAEPSGPPDLGESAHTGTAKIADPGDTAVEFITWYLPTEGRTTEITFALLVPDCDAIGSCRWISDIYGYTQHDVRLPPVRTVVQSAIDICWLTDENDEVVYNTSSLPDGDGNVSFRILKSTGSVTLVCDISNEAETVTIGTTLSSIRIFDYNENPEYAESSTYLSYYSPLAVPAQRVTIR